MTTNYQKLVAFAKKIKESRDVAAEKGDPNLYFYGTLAEIVETALKHAITEIQCNIMVSYQAYPDEIKDAAYAMDRDAR